MILGAGLAILAVRIAWDDPLRPYSNMLAALAASVLYGLVALWRPRPASVYVSGLLLNLVGTFAWMAWAGGRLDVAVWVHVLCFAAAAIVWSTVEQRLGQTEQLRADLAARLPTWRSASAFSC